MTYLPSEYINSNYTYSINDTYYVVRTNNNCYTNYSRQYCDCYNVYPKNDYLVSGSYSCDTTNVSAVVSYDNFTSSYWYRSDMPQILLMFLILIIFIVYFPYRIISRLFGRWLKI